MTSNDEKILQAVYTMPGSTVGQLYSWLFNSYTYPDLPSGGKEKERELRTMEAVLEYNVSIKKLYKECSLDKKAKIVTRYYYHYTLETTLGKQVDTKRFYPYQIKLYNDRVERGWDEWSAGRGLDGSYFEPNLWKYRRTIWKIIYKSPDHIANAQTIVVLLRKKYKYLEQVPRPILQSYVCTTASLMVLSHYRNMKYLDTDGYIIKK